LNLYAMARDNPETFADLDGYYLPAPDAADAWIGTGVSPTGSYGGQPPPQNSFGSIDSFAHYYYEQAGEHKQKPKNKSKQKNKGQMVVTSYLVLKNVNFAESRTLTTDTFGVGYRDASGKITPAPSDETHTINMAETYEPGHKGNALICSPVCSMSVGWGAVGHPDFMYAGHADDFILDKRFTIDGQTVQGCDRETGRGGDYIRQVDANGTTTLTYQKNQ
jgi:hypothetical protein